MDINELLGLEGEALAAALAGLNGDQLAEYETALITAANDLKEDTPENVVQLNKIASVLDGIRDAHTALEAALEQAKADGAAARARIAGEPANGEDADAQSTTDADADAESDADADAEGDAEAETAGEPALVAGGGSRIRRMARQTGRAKPSPEAPAPANRIKATLTASGALTQTGFIKDPGGRIQSSEELGAAVAELLNSMPRQGAPRGRVLVASARWQLPEDRQLRSDDIAHNNRIMEKALGPKPFLSLPEEALVASGGIASPVNVDYSVPGWSTTDRPIRDALPSFQADRGGIMFVPPRDIATYAGATTVWPEATDANPAGATKPVVQVAPNSPTTVYVDAVPTRLGFGNLTARFAPEQTAADIDLAMAAAARIAENNLLDLIAGSCVTGVTNTQVLGATRDLLRLIHLAVAAYRSAHRIPETVKFTAIFPFWVKNLLKIDLAFEIGHAQTQYYDALQITDEYLESVLNNAGVNPVWHLDGQDDSYEGSVAQILQIQATGAINQFPTDVVWYLFPEGVFQFLDAGRLDLGVVRDSTLDATNDYETFVEPFEGLAFRGFSSGALQLTSTLKPTGGTSGTVSVSS